MDIHPRAHRYPEPEPCPEWVVLVQGREIHTMKGAAYRIETTGRWTGTKTNVVSTSWVSLEDAR